ncbi:hypothetical protein COBT_001246 [Conglomerata obtusa]
MYRKIILTYTKYCLIHTYITWVNAQHVNSLVEYFQGIQDEVIKKEQVIIERQHHNVYIAFSFFSLSEGWDVVMKETCLKFLKLYKKMHQDYDKNWSLSTLKHGNIIEVLDSLYILVKYTINKRSSNSHEYKSNDDKCWDLCYTEIEKNLNVKKIAILAIEKQPCKLMIIGNCFEQASDYFVMLRDMKLLCTQIEDADLILICLKFENNAEKTSWIDAFKDLQVFKMKKREFPNCPIYLINDRIKTDAYDSNELWYLIFIKSKSMYETCPDTVEYNELQYNYRKLPYPAYASHSLFAPLYLYNTWKYNDYQFFFPTIRFPHGKDPLISWKITFENFYEKMDILMSFHTSKIENNIILATKESCWVDFFIGYCYNNSGIVIFNMGYTLEYENLEEQNKRINDILPIIINYSKDHGPSNECVEIFKKILNLDYYKLESTIILNESFKRVFIKSCYYDTTMNDFIEIRKESFNINTIVIDICRFLRSIFIHGSKIFLCKNFVDPKKIYEYSKLMYKFGLYSDVIRVEFLFEITDDVNLQEYVFDGDYIINVCIILGYGVRTYNIYLPSLAMKIKEFETFCDQKSKFIEQILQTEMENKGEEKSKTIIAVLKCSICILVSHELHFLYANRKVMGNNLDLILDCFYIRTTYFNEHYKKLYSIFSEKELEKLKKISNASDSFDDNLIAIHHELIKHAEYKNDNTIYKKIIYNCFDTLKNEFQNFADEQKIEYLMISSEKGFVYSHHYTIVDEIKLFFANQNFE